ncbi:MAG: CDP-glycerol glycerophosphotransferase family protein [Rhodospirillales bacterium]|nr:CDP-glycerol glycerophosphotransferase family protein [Rhodospirillales bacterium]
MKQKLKILIFIESDFVIRNFLKAGAFDNLIEKHDVRYVMPSPEYKRFTVATPPDVFKAPIHRVDIPEDRVLMWVWLFLADQMRLTFNKSLRKRRSMYVYAAGSKAALLFTLAQLPILKTLFKRYVQKRLAESPCTELTNILDQEQPDINIHPSTFDGCYISDLIIEGKRRSIPTVILMNSWDNPSLKRSMAGVPDWITVWGEQTKQHTHHFMKTPLDRIIKLGAAQFEVFRNPPRITREQFCMEHGIDLRNKIVLYAGSSRNTNELAELKILDERIARGEISNISIVYRPHPWGNGGGPGGAEIINVQWKNIVIENSMREYLTRLSKGDKTPDTADYKRTHDILSAIDVLISPFSTIILEGALHGKPVMCLMTSKSKSIEVRKDLIHFQEMFSLATISEAYQDDDLIECIRDLIAKSDDPEFKTTILNDMKFFVETPGEPYHIALTEVIENIANYPQDAKATL